MDFDKEIERLKELVEKGLDSYLPRAEGEAKTLYEAMRYTVLAPGKRIRPLLLLLSSKACLGTEEEALPYACALEFIHNYSLIHDDLPSMDNDDLRRGRPTCHKVYGEAMAILAGDGLLSRAMELIHEAYQAGNSPLVQRVEAGAVIVRGCGCGGMVAGQVVDIESEGKEVSAGLLDFIHSNKTAALISAAVVAGACLGKARSSALPRAMAVYGESIGLAFQIVDDILDAEGETGVIGKTAGKDAAAGKATYVSVNGVKAARERLAELTGIAVDAVLMNKHEDGADEECMELLAEFARRLAARIK